MLILRPSFLLLVLASVIPLGVNQVACSGSTNQGESTESTSASQVQGIDDPWLRIKGVREWTGDLDGMIERGFIRILVIHSKTFYFLDGARERGISAEKIRALEEFLNKRLRKDKQSIDVVTIPIRRDQAIPYLVKGIGDIALGSWTVTPEREKEIDFSNYRFPGVSEVVLIAPNGPDISSIEDLSGMEIHVRRSSSYYESLQTLNKRLKSEGKPEVIICLAEEALEDEDLVEMLNANLLPATVMDTHKWEWIWSKVFPDVKMNPNAVIREGGEIAQMMRKNSPQLQAMFDDFRKTNPVKGTFVNVVLNQYMKGTKWILNSNSSSERKKFLAVIEYFKKYGKQYGFDYLMLAAQGYQESKLDQNARSSVGAIGIMQLMPATAAGSPVFIPNVHEVEPNVHAGVKYMRYIVDQYFNDSEIDEVNKLLFAFAAYNAGPNRVHRLRKLAPEYGFDPNIWFNNVERIVERKVGREPTRYVGNIYKYYVAYKRIREMEERNQKK